ncbi:MAG TPA: TMEM175 family protein [Micromonosporaceae bacterium]
MAHNEEAPERLVFFSDAVIAIAMTLLALDLPVPHADHRTNQTLWHDFLQHWHTDYFPFLLSFVVIAAFWNTHHRMFGYVARLGRGVVPANFAFLLTVILVPFVTRVLGVDGGYQVGDVLYAADLAALAGSLALLAYLSRSDELLKPGAPPSVMTDFVLGLIPTAAVFLLSIPVAVASPGSATLVWLLLIIAGRITDRIVSRSRRARATRRAANADSGALAATERTEENE